MCSIANSTQWYNQTLKTLIGSNGFTASKNIIIYQWKIQYLDPNGL
jgi:hypothetical protein